MIGELDLVALACSINHAVNVEVEEVGSVQLVVDLTATVSLVLTDQLTQVLRYQTVLTDVTRTECTCTYIATQTQAQ